MNKGDYVWGGLILMWVTILIVPTSREQFLILTESYPYISGFIKFAILATMGDLLGIRIAQKKWIKPNGFLFKVIIWGIIGMMITLVFPLYMGGTLAAQLAGRLPFCGLAIAQAFFCSSIMNVTFGPMMMFFHRFTDLYIETKLENKGDSVWMIDLIEKNDWYSLIGFSWFKTCPLFWIPAHTLVFLLPAQYRVIASAFLSVALGLMLTISKRTKLVTQEI